MTDAEFEKNFEDFDKYFPEPKQKMSGIERSLLAVIRFGIAVTVVAAVGPVAVFVLFWLAAIVLGVLGIL